MPLSEKQKKNSRDDEDHVYTESVSLSLKTEAKKSLPVFLFQILYPSLDGIMPKRKEMTWACILLIEPGRDRHLWMVNNDPEVVKAYSVLEGCFPLLCCIIYVLL